MDPQQDAAPDPLIGKVLGGRFTVRNLIGEGGMGAVYLGEQKLGGTTRKVAIKTLHAHLSHDPKILARFERECGTVAELQHPNTIQVFDYGKTDDGILFIVMEYVEGKSVAEVLEKEGPMAPARVENILKQVGGSLQEAHDHGIVHRDLKPDNVVLCERAGQKDWVEVLDFGIAKRSNEEDKNEQKLTQQGMVLGTPPYMSPEQFTGEPIDKRSDIYSLGVMAYEMLTGRLPFSGNTAWEWATQHMTAAPQPLEATPIGARIPEHMRRAIERALQKRREERFDTVKDFVDAFGGAGAPAGVAADHHGHAGGTAPLAAAAAAAAGAGGGGAPRVKTEVGAAPDAAAMGYGAAPGGYGASMPSPQPPVAAGYGAPPPPQGMTPASGHQAFVAPQAAYGQPDAEPGGGGKRGLIVGVLVVALLAFGGVALVGAGVFKKKEPADNIFGSSTAPPPTTIAVPTSTDTGGTASTGTTPTPTVEQTTKPTTTGSKPPAAHPSSKPTGTTTTTATATATTPPTTTATATTPPAKTTTPPPPPPPPQPNPPECALAQKFCSNPASHTPGSPMQAACTSNKSACLQKGGHL